MKSPVASFVAETSGLLDEEGWGIAFVEDNNINKEHSHHHYSCDLEAISQSLVNFPVQETEWKNKRVLAGPPR